MSQDVSQTIYSSALLCSGLFQRILDLTDNENPLFLLAEELDGRFSLWAAYTGVYAAPIASLDARLDAHKEIRDMVLELVEMVRRNLQWELNIQSKNTTRTQKPLNPADGDACDDSSIDVLGLHAAEAAIDRLLIIAVEIRRSARRNHKMRQGTNDQQAELCCLLVKAKYPNARPSLRNQLGASIHTRGTSLLYWKMHNKKLAFKRHGPGSVQDAADIASENNDPESDYCVDGPNNKEQPKVLAPETRPSVSSQSVLDRIAQAKNRPSGSIASIGWTVRDGQGDTFDYPQKPDMTNGKKYQSCTLCAKPLEESDLNEEAWKAHVDQDLKPYVCISEECREPSRYFVRRRDWLDHMQTRHSMTWAEKIHTELWYCDIGHEKPLEFDEKELFVAHLKTEHGNQLTKSKLEGRARRNRRIATREPFVCPLCDCIPDDLEPRIQERLWSHIALHLKSLAFLSLSYLDDDPESKESIAEPSESYEKDYSNASRTSFRDRNLESFDDISTTIVLQNGMRSVDGQELPGELPLLSEPQDWTLMYFDPPQPDFELLRTQIQGLRSNQSKLAVRKPSRASSLSQEAGENVAVVRQDSNSIFELQALDDEGPSTGGLCLLSLDGDGPRGLATLYVLHGLMGRLNDKRRNLGLPSVRPCDIFDLIGGTGTGGFIAIMLGRMRMDVRECIVEYCKITATIFSEPSPMLGTAIHAHRSRIALRGFIQDQGFDPSEQFAEIQDPECKVFVCATAAESIDQIKHLRSYSLMGRNDDEPVTLIQAALATLLATDVFHSILVEDYTYVASVRATNNPVHEVEMEARELWCPENADLQSLVECFLSIGAGNPGEVERKLDPVSEDLLRTTGEVERVATESEGAAATFLKRWRHVNGPERYFRFNVEYGLERTGSREYKMQAVIRDASRRYLEHHMQRSAVRKFVGSMAGKLGI